MAGAIRLPVNRFADANLRDALLKLESGTNENTARLNGLLTQFKGQAAPPTIPGSIITANIYPLAPANVSTSAAAVGTSSLASPGDHVHFLDTTAAPFANYLLQNGSRPLTSAWDAGNFAITLGSIVGKSGTLAITSASGGAMTFSSSVASGGTGFTFTDTVVRTAGNSFSFVDGAGTSRLTIGDSTANAPCFTFSTAASGLIGHTAVWKVTGTAVRNATGAFNGIEATLVNNGTGIVSGMFISSTQGGPTGTLLQSGGFDIFPKYASTSTFGNNGANPATQRNRLYGGNLTLTFTNSATTGNNINAWGLNISNTGTPDGAADPVVGQASINRWAGILIGTRPANLEDSKTFGIFSKEDIGIASGRSFVFDDSCTFTAATTQTNDFSAHTKGTTYMLKTGNTIAAFVNAAQAFHFDQNGAAGTSRCYGNLLISGTTTSTGLLTGSAGITATTGDITATAGNIVATAGNIQTSAGDLISASDVVVADGSYLKMDGTTGNYGLVKSGTAVAFVAGGSVRGQWLASGIDVSSGNTYTINSNKLTLSETGLTHNPTAAGLFTITLNDRMLITSSVAAPGGDMVDIFRNSSSGTPVIFRVRDAVGGATDYLKVTTSTGVLIGGASTTKVGFWGATPVVRPSAYTPTNVTTDHSYDANATTTDELADVLGTLIADLQSIGILA